MKRAIDNFRRSIQKVRDLDGLYSTLSIQTTKGVDLSDLLRAEIVLAASALDYFVHEITVLGMLDCYNGHREVTESFAKFPIPLGMVKNLSTESIESEIRLKHSYKSFQTPDKIADAIRLFNSTPVWEHVANELGIDQKEIKDKLKLIIDRRNKIVHEADIKPSYLLEYWEIQQSDAQESVDLIEKIAGSIFTLIES